MCSTGDKKMGVADSSVVIIRATCCFLVVNIVVDVVVALDSRGLFRTLFRVLEVGA